MATDVVSRTLHASFVAAVKEIRNRLGEANVPSFDFHIAAEGNTLSDASEILIEYNLSAPRYCGSHVKGNDLGRVIDESLRRNGWDKTNSPKALAPPRKSRVDDETY